MRQNSHSDQIGDGIDCGVGAAPASPISAEPIRDLPHLLGKLHELLDLRDPGEPMTPEDQAWVLALLLALKAPLEWLEQWAAHREEPNDGPDGGEP